jgi:hypothetical protein
MVPQPRVNDKRIDEAPGERKRFSSTARAHLEVVEVARLLLDHVAPRRSFGQATIVRPLSVRAVQAHLSQRAVCDLTGQYTWS